MFAAIIVPFLLFEKQFEALGAWLASGHASGWTSASIIAGLLALDVFLPVPSSIVSTGAGVLLGFWRGSAVIWIGMVLGCAIGYAFGARAAGAARRLVGEDSLVKAGGHGAARPVGARHLPADSRSRRIEHRVCRPRACAARAVRLADRRCRTSASPSRTRPSARSR